MVAYDAAAARAVARLGEANGGGQDLFEQQGWDYGRCNWTDILKDDQTGAVMACRCKEDPVEYLPAQGRIDEDVFLSGRYWCSCHALRIVEGHFAGQPVRLDIDQLSAERIRYRGQKAAMTQITEARKEHEREALIEKLKESA